MANLFFVHTPFQLFVAQQIINQEKLQDNLILENYIPGNKHFLDIYDLIIIPEMWKEQLMEPCFLGWAVVHFKYFPSLNTLLSTRRKMNVFMGNLDKLIQEKHVKKLFLGEISNSGLQLIAEIYHKKGVEIAFFEEGCSHYQYRPFPKKNTIVKKLYYKLLELLLDAMVYKPLLGFCFADHFYCKHKYEELHYDNRYSIINCYNSNRDKPVVIANLFSSQLKNYFMSELGAIDPENQKVYLFISSLVYEVTTVEDFFVEEEVVDDMAKQLDHNAILLVKYHPREKEEHIERLNAIFKKYNLQYRILGSKYNIPVEFYLQYMSFSKIFAFANSSIYYNGFIFPKTEMVRLDLNYLEKYREHGLPNLDRVQRYCDVFTKSINYFTELANRKG